ncbi:hypothetical protein MMC17_002630 [Xylographa soralifera]|nr:hypothetical protein [Xylographa soralifera]
MPLTSLRSSSSRRDIIIVVSIICILTVIISFRTIYTRDGSWRRPVGELPTFGNGETKTPSESEETTKSKAPLPVVTSISSVAVTTSTSTSSTLVSSPTAAASVAITGGCDGFPDTKDILVVMKTGATEAYDKLPIHFMTTLRCVNDSILFSDMEMDMAGHKVIDTLDEVADDIKKDNGDFDLYRLLQEYHKLHEDPRPLKEGSNGWNLDKYKFVHMLLKTYKYRPNVPWYVFIEADTGVIWDNMRTFLNKYDPQRPYYFGSPTYLDIEFAHGGTGYIISQAAMAAAVGKHLDIATKYDKDVQGICCGDRMIGRILLDENIKLTKAWPMLNGEKPITLPFSKRHWCQPVITMHHMTAQEVSEVWNFEQERKAQGITTPLLFMEVFSHFVKSSLLSTRADWTNLSDDITYTPPSSEDPDRSYNGRTWAELGPIERASPESADNCKAACDADDGCFQWQQHDQVCALHHSIRLGESKRGMQSTWVSGWKMDKIEKFQAEMGECKSGADWAGWGR